MRLPAIIRRTASALVAQDAEGLIAAHGLGAYDEARTRARQARLGEVLDGNRPADHWDSVRREIAKRTGRQVGLDTGTRYLGH